jgi:hypothetical protein
MTLAENVGSIESILGNTRSNAITQQSVADRVTQRADIIDIEPYLRKKPSFYLERGEETSYQNLMDAVERFVRNDKDHRHHADDIMAVTHYMLVFKRTLQEKKKKKSDLLKRNILLEGAVEETMRDRKAEDLDYSRLDSESPYVGQYSDQAMQVLHENPWFSPGRIKTDEQMLQSTLGAFKDYGKVVRNHSYLMHMVRSDKTPEPDRMEQLPTFIIYHTKEFADLVRNNIPKTRYN